jgi:alkylation response protein AidB-like acyl-CoA dehydrogenase
MKFFPTRLSESEVAFQADVRLFVREAIPAHRKTMLGMAGVDGRDPAFSRAIARKGWLGLSIPTEFGGWGRSPVERLLLTEEMLAAQAPVAAHWIADRQSAPMIASRGTPEQKARLIPPIVAGESWFSIGMSEPDSGSDLASVKTTATRVEGGWSLNGTKVWTTFAQYNHWLIVLCRTSVSSEKHEGLSQLLVDLHSPGVAVRPITTLDGEQEFCEVVLSNVFVPDDLLLGREGDGWAQVTGELAFERGGPDRYLSAWGLFEWLVESAPTGSEEAIGRLVSRYRIVRELALSAARSLEIGGSLITEAAVIKDLGTILEQDTVEAVRLWLSLDLDRGAADRHEQLLARAVLTAPTFTLRGGTTQVLRGVVGRSAGDLVRHPTDDVLGATVERILRENLVDERSGDFAIKAWSALWESGIPLVGIPEEHGGSGGTIQDAAKVLGMAGALAAPLPLAETGLLGGWLIAQAGIQIPPGPLTVALRHELVLADDLLRGPVHRVPFSENAALVLTVVGDRLVGFRPTRSDGGRALCGEPRGSFELQGLPTLINVPAPCGINDLCDRGAATRVILMAGALRSVLKLTALYSQTRKQFGQSISRFQAVGHQVAVLAEQVARVEMAAELATRWLEGVADRDDLAVATVTAREASTLGARLAHQVHGAIGIAEEYDLQLFTRRLWTWRDECGAEREWAVALGMSATAAPHLWSWVSRSPRPSSVDTR